MQKGFDIKKTLGQLKQISQSIKERSDLPFQTLYQLLGDLCIVFKELNTFLGIAFNDIKQKTKILQENNKRFPGHNGVISFIKMQLKDNIFHYNGKNNSKLKAPNQFKNYNSTTRNTLRIMWLLTFVRTMFQQYQKNIKSKLSTVLGLAYDQAFGANHSWMIRKSAKLAIYASPGVERLMQVLLGNENQEQFKNTTIEILLYLKPIHEFLWEFYKENKLVDLE